MGSTGDYPPNKLDRFYLHLDAVTKHASTRELVQMPGLSIEVYRFFLLAGDLIGKPMPHTGNAAYTWAHANKPTVVFLYHAGLLEDTS